MKVIQSIQISKVHASSHEITNINMGPNYENNEKSMATDLIANDAETNTSDVDKIKFLREQKLKLEANNKQYIG